MTPAVLLVVLVAGVLHATWNAMAKALDDRLVAFSLIGVSSAVCGADMLLVSGLPNSKAMPFAIASAAVHLLYEVGLMQSYRLGSFNQTYPLARGTAPLVVALGAYLATGERLGAVPAAGIAV
ncbi:MAG TPA: hypothetical protein VGS21_06255, partial [Acidimicrobiales bacterium]|nr:hypothetical protein [Acidimicrobiales bacterium]